jgi:hypothetical protein
MIYIQLTKDDNGVGFVTLAKSGPSVLCLPDDIYGVATEHLKLLRQKQIPFKKHEGYRVRLQQPSLPHDEEI